MRAYAVVLILLIGASAAPATAKTRISVDDLDKLLADSRNKTDAALADELSTLELTRRAIPSRMSSWSAAVPGPKSRLTLLALADASAFLPPPATDIPELPAPDPAEQRRILAAAAEYVKRTLPTLPNFFADRVTTHFDNLSGTSKSNAYVQDRLHFVSSSTVTVLYRDQKEVLDSGDSPSQKTRQVLVTQGEFGSILGLVIGDLAHGQADWSRWDKGPAGNYAVFGYSVPRFASHYAVSSSLTGLLAFMTAARPPDVPGYHGEITIDPAGGAVMRLSLQADMDPLSSVSRADIVVEYGAMDIGGRMYICPVSSVALGQIRIDGMPAGLAPAGNNAAHSAMGVNHTDFQRYHIFRSESRILPGDAPQ